MFSQNLIRKRREQNFLIETNDFKHEREISRHISRSLVPVHASSSSQNIFEHFEEKENSQLERSQYQNPNKITPKNTQNKSLLLNNTIYLGRAFQMSKGTSDAASPAQEVNMDDPNADASDSDDGQDLAIGLEKKLVVVSLQSSTSTTIPPLLSSRYEQ